MKRDDPIWFKNLAERRQHQRHEIIEQAGCRMVRFRVDDHLKAFPYCHLSRVECEIENDRYQLAASWMDFEVKIEGYHLERLCDLLMEQRLHSVTLRTQVEEEREDDEPYLEQISFIEAGSLSHREVCGS